MPNLAKDKGKPAKISHETEVAFIIKFGIYRAISRLNGKIRHNNTADQSEKNATEINGKSMRFVIIATSGKLPKKPMLSGIAKVSAAIITAKESENLSGINLENSL